MTGVEVRPIINARDEQGAGKGQTRPGCPATPLAGGTAGVHPEVSDSSDDTGRPGRLPRGFRPRGRRALPSDRHRLADALIDHPGFGELNGTDRYRLLVAALRLTDGEGRFWHKRKTWASTAGDLDEGADQKEVASAERAYSRTIGSAVRAGVLEVEPHGRVYPGAGVRQTSNTYRWAPELLGALRGEEADEPDAFLVEAVEEDLAGCWPQTGADPSHQDTNVRVAPSHQDEYVPAVGQDKYVPAAGQDTNVLAGTEGSEREELNGRATNRGAHRGARADEPTATCYSCDGRFPSEAIHNEFCADCAAKYRSPHPHNEQQPGAAEAQASA